MVPVILDTETGETAKGDDFPVFWWLEGNGSCDCNRALAFGNEDDSQFCIGCNRYIIIDAEGNLEGYTRGAIVVLANDEYDGKLRVWAVDEHARRPKHN